MDLFHKRQGMDVPGLCYFYTDAIHQFKNLLADDALKMEVIYSLKYFVDKDLISLYGFVTMPNHIHLLWDIHDQNGKESVAGSFAKFTAHRFKKHLLLEGQLSIYSSDKADRSFQFWKRDPLAFPISSEKILISKLDYIHFNPVKAGICQVPEDYRWSSARFYFDGVDEFGIVTHFKG